MSKFKRLLDDWDLPPDLQHLVAERGGWDRVSPEDWKAYQAAMQQYLDRMTTGQLKKYRNAVGSKYTQKWGPR